MANPVDDGPQTYHAVNGGPVDLPRVPRQEQPEITRHESEMLRQARELGLLDDSPHHTDKSVKVRTRPVRRYLPTFAELVDRLAILQLKSVFIPENGHAYGQEMADIEHDINVILEAKEDEGYRIRAADIRAILVVMLTNREIWLNESKARQGGSEQDSLLKFSHSVNGVRNSAKNVLSVNAKDRIDLKVDCFAAELVEEYGDWDIYGGIAKG